MPLKFIKVHQFEWNSEVLTTFAMILFLCSVIGFVGSVETGSRKGGGSSKLDSIQKQKINDDTLAKSPHNLRNDLEMSYKSKGSRNEEISSKDEDNQDPSTPKEFLTQLFTKWMSFSEMSSSKAKSLDSNKFDKLVRQLSSLKKWISSSSEESSTGRTFLLAPLLTAIPIMAAEIITIGGMGLLAPAFIIMPLVLVPLLFVGFIIFL